MKCDSSGTLFTRFNRSCIVDFNDLANSDDFILMTYHYSKCSLSMSCKGCGTAGVVPYYNSR